MATAAAPSVHKMSQIAGAEGATWTRTDERSRFHHSCKGKHLRAPSQKRAQAGAARL